MMNPKLNKLIKLARDLNNTAFSHHYDGDCVEYLHEMVNTLSFSIEGAPPPLYDSEDVELLEKLIDNGGLTTWWKSDGNIIYFNWPQIKNIDTKETYIREASVRC